MRAGVSTSCPVTISFKEQDIKPVTLYKV